MKTFGTFADNSSPSTDLSRLILDREIQGFSLVPEERSRIFETKLIDEEEVIPKPRSSLELTSVILSLFSHELDFERVFEPMIQDAREELRECLEQKKRIKCIQLQIAYRIRIFQVLTWIVVSRTIGKVFSLMPFLIICVLVALHSIEASKWLLARYWLD